MNNVINLNEYKLKKEGEELDELESAISNIISQLKLDDHPLPPIDPNAFSIPVPHGLFIPPATYYSDQRTHDIEACADLLNCVSNLLSEYNEIELSNKVANLEVRVKQLLT